MKKFAMTYATIGGLINNAEIRAVSPAVQQAYESMNIEAAGAACSACAKRKKLSDASGPLINKLQSSSDAELARIKKTLGVDILVFPNGMSFVER